MASILLNTKPSWFLVASLMQESKKKSQMVPTFTSNCYQIARYGISRKYVEGEWKYKESKKKNCMLKP
jgi:hypothetical protein